MDGGAFLQTLTFKRFNIKIYYFKFIFTYLITCLLNNNHFMTPKFLLILVLLTFCSSQIDYSMTDVVQLDDRNFENLVINSSELWFVHFYAPWSHHDRKTVPEWKKAASILKGFVKFGAYNASENEIRKSSMYEMILFGNQNEYLYEISREANDMIEFAKEKISETINLRLSGNKSESNESLYNEERSNEQNEKETLKIPIDL